MNGLNKNFKVILTSSLFPLILVLLITFSMKFGFSKVGNVKEKITAAKKDINTLEAKSAILSQISDNSVVNTGVASAALPGENPAAILLSQLKILQTQYATLIENFKSSAPVKNDEGVSTVDVSFDVSGERTGVTSFLDAISTLAPISYVSKVKMNEDGAITHATVTVTSFWSSYPSKIPAVTEQLNILTSDESEILNDMSRLVQPRFIDFPPAVTGNDQNPNPFGVQ